MKIELIDLKQRYKEESSQILTSIKKVLSKGHLVLTEELNNFENNICKYTGSKYCLGLNSGTDALMMSLWALGIGKGDEVITSPTSFVATIGAIIHVGAKPIFVDISDDLNMDVSKIESKITKKTKAIMVVHLFGQTTNMKKIMKLAKKYKLKIIEDCAESHGVECFKKRVGSFGDVSAFSFYFNKTITSGEGGMVVTNSKKIADKAKLFKNLCYGKINRFMHSNIGYNYRMANLNAALALGQLRNIKSIIKKKKEIYSQYFKNLSKLHFVKIPKKEKWETNYIMWLFNICVDEKKIKRNYLMKKLLKDYKIETRTSFIPINFQNVLIKKFSKIKKNSCKNANYIMRNGLYLPSGNNLTMKKINFVCKAIEKIYKDL